MSERATDQIEDLQAQLEVVKTELRAMMKRAEEAENELESASIIQQTHFREGARWTRERHEMEDRINKLQDLLEMSDATLAPMRERAEAAEQKLAEYKANRFTVDAKGMVEQLRDGFVDLCPEIGWEFYKNGEKFVVKDRAYYSPVTESLAMTFITAGAAMMHILNEQEMEGSDEL